MVINISEIKVAYKNSLKKYKKNCKFKKFFVICFVPKTNSHDFVEPNLH